MDEETLRQARQLAYESVVATREGGFVALKDRLRSWGGITRTTDNLGNVITTAIAKTADQVTQTVKDADATVTWADWLDGYEASGHRKTATPTATAAVLGDWIRGLGIDKQAFLLWGGVAVTLYALVGFELQMGLPVTNTLIKSVMGPGYEVEWHGLGFWVPTLGEMIYWILHSIAFIAVEIFGLGDMVVTKTTSWTSWAVMAMLVRPAVHYSGRVWALVTGKAQHARDVLEVREDVTIARQRLRALRRNLPKYLLILGLIGAALAFAWNSVVGGDSEDTHAHAYAVPSWHATADPDYRMYSLGSSSHYVGNMHQSVTWDEWAAKPVRETGVESTEEVAPSDVETVTATTTMTIERVETSLVTPPPTERPSVRTPAPVSHNFDGEDCVDGMRYCHTCKQLHWCGLE